MSFTGILLWCYGLTHPQRAHAWTSEKYCRQGFAVLIYVQLWTRGTVNALSQANAERNCAVEATWTGQKISILLMKAQNHFPQLPNDIMLGQL